MPGLQFGLKARIQVSNGWWPGRIWLASPIQAASDSVDLSSLQRDVGKVRGYRINFWTLSSGDGKEKAFQMGYIQEARDNHVKKKVEEGTTTLTIPLNPSKTRFNSWNLSLFVFFKKKLEVKWIVNFRIYGIMDFGLKWVGSVLHFAALRSKMKQKALKECDQFTSKYAQCASGRTLSVVWQCRKQAKELNNCLHQ